MNYARVNPGDPIRPRASFVNALADLLENERRLGRQASRSPLEVDFYTAVMIQNKGTTFIPAGGVARATDSLIDPTENLNRFFGRPVLAVEAASGSNEDATAVVAADRVEVNGFGIAAIAGVVQCRVNVSDAGHAFAKPSTSTAWELESDAAEGFPIVYKASGTGVVWAIVEVREVAPATAGGVFAAVVTGSSTTANDWEFAYTIKAAATLSGASSAWTTTGPDLNAYNAAERIAFANFAPAPVSDGVGVLALEVDTDVYAFSLAPIEGACS